MQKVFVNLYGTFYKYFLKRIFFLLDPEFIHEFIVSYGEKLGSHRVPRLILKCLFFVKNKSLSQKLSGMKFENPVGLAAGFDYEGQLTEILPSLSFGFQTIGTITNQAYEGNPKPRLGRLIKSQSLMVNKGFKNPGIRAIIKKLQRTKFITPVGLSIGKTNSGKEMTQEEAIKDIIAAFRIAESSRVQFSFYELNISCPNLLGKVTFYPPKNLQELLEKVTKLRLKRPIFIKMPISKTDKEIRQMLNVIIKFPIAGVIIGNVQTNRKDKSFYKEELRKFPMGNFSGKPTEQRSNELISLAYNNYGKKLIIIGCGGVFSPEDTYKKIRLGASAIQLITGLIFEGLQLPAKINLGLVDLLRKDGFKNITEAIGIDSNLRS